jgi:hypothetical protein
MNKIFTATLHDVAGDTANESWIAEGDVQVAAIRTSLETLGFEYSEDDVDLDQRLFSVEIQEDGYQTHSYKTAEQINALIKESGLRLDAETFAAVQAFMARVPNRDEEYIFEGGECSLKLLLCYEPGDVVGKN